MMGTDPHSVEWTKSIGYSTTDEIRFVQRLAATEPMKFFAYAETMHLRKRWGRIDPSTIARRVNQLLVARQPRMPMAA